MKLNLIQKFYSAVRFHSQTQGNSKNSHNKSHYQLELLDTSELRIPEIHVYAVRLKKKNILREISELSSLLNDDKNQTQESNNSSKNPGDEESPVPFNNRDFLSQRVFTTNAAAESKSI